MYSEWVWVLLGALFIWLLFLSFLVWQLRGFFKSLFPKSGERDIRKKFGEIVETTISFGSKLDKLESKLSEFEKQASLYIQRVELLRYNPYDDTGGDQSFSVALLNKQGSGIVVTSLHSRSGTRVFAKSVIKGKSEKYQFSKEEQEVIKKAINLKNE